MSGYQERRGRGARDVELPGKKGQAEVQGRRTIGSGSREGVLESLALKVRK